MAEFLKKIFNVTNTYTFCGKYKVLTILGMKFSVPKKSKAFQVKRFFNHKVKPKSILYLEMNGCHGEVIPGYLKYLHELGYNVDLMVVPELARDIPLSRLERNFYNELFALELWDMRDILISKKIQEYDYCLLNSNYIYVSGGKQYSFREVFEKVEQPRNGYLVIEHHLDKINPVMIAENRVLQLADFKNASGKNAVFCNPNYFGEIKEHKKNEVINFISIGSHSLRRRNSNLLFDGVKELLKSGISNFKITLIGRNISLEGLSDEELNHFDIKGHLSFEEMFEELEKADFLLTLLDPEVEDHSRYLKDGTSGSFQLVYGFNLPCVIPEKFAEVHKFNKDNAIIHKNGSDFAETLKRCIELSEAEYDSLKRNLAKTVSTIREESKNNLKEILQFRRYRIISLGQSCMPRTLATEYGLKKRRCQGELSMPFDLAWHSSEMVVKSLESDFKNYLNDIDYSYSRKFFVNRKSKKLNILYNHDKNYFAWDKKKFIKKLRSRIQNFRGALLSDDYLYFILSGYTDNSIVQRMYSIIKQRRGDKPFKFFVLDYKNKIDAFENIISIKVSAGWDVDKGNWFKPEGQSAFQSYIQDVGKIIADEMSKDVDVIYYMSN